MSTDSSTTANLKVRPHLGTYRRVLPVSVERLYENAIDWEHLAYLHRSSFARVECLEAGAWGFRARVWSQPYDAQLYVRHRVEARSRLSPLDHLYSSRAPAMAARFWMHAFPVAERETHIVVDYFRPRLETLTALAPASRLTKVSTPGSMMKTSR